MGHVKSNSPKSSFGYKIKSAASTGAAIASGLKTASDIGKTVYTVHGAPLGEDTQKQK